MDEGNGNQKPPPRNHAVTAALLGGAAAAAAGAVWGARTIARRSGAGDGKPLNSVMETAVTASELAQGSAATSSAEPKVPSEPRVGREPSVPR